MFRSRNEADRTKTAEKCMKQLQALIDQFRDQDVTTLEKIDYAFCTQYPMSWGIKKELADLYKKIGIFMSAHELLESVGLHEESIKCLFMAGRQAPAIKMAEELAAKPGFRNYNIFCLMGEMKCDHTFYQRAWDESDGKCSRAARSLGRYYFFVPDYAKSIEFFEKGLKINKLYPDTWFTLGCAYMKSEDYKGAS